MLIIHFSHFIYIKKVRVKSCFRKMKSNKKTSNDNRKNELYAIKVLGEMIILTIKLKSCFSYLFSITWNGCFTKSTLEWSTYLGKNNLLFIQIGINPTPSTISLPLASVFAKSVLQTIPEKDLRNLANPKAVKFEFFK